MLDAADVKLTSVNIFNGKAIGGNGGAIYADISGASIAAILTFELCSATPMSLFEATDGNGGFFYLNNPLF